MLVPPLNIPQWLSENSHFLQPPINNHCIHSAGPEHDMTIMIVGGPNARTDYHINSTPELFYQVKGSMLLRVVDHENALTTGTGSGTENGVSSPLPESAFRDIPIHEGSLFLLPGNTPHNPIRFRDTVGLVVELSRPRAEAGTEAGAGAGAESLGKEAKGARPDRVRWYCQECRSVVFETTVYDLGPGLKGAVQAFANDDKARTCKSCGALCDVVPRGVVQP